MHTRRIQGSRCQNWALGELTVDGLTCTPPKGTFLCMHTRRIQPPRCQSRALWELTVDSLNLGCTPPHKGASPCLRTLKGFSHPDAKNRASGELTVDSLSRTITRHKTTSGTDRPPKTSLRNKSTRNKQPPRVERRRAEEVRMNHPGLLIVPGLGELQRTSEMRTEAWPRGTLEDSRT